MGENKLVIELEIHEFIKAQINRVISNFIREFPTVIANRVILDIEYNFRSDMEEDEDFDYDITPDDYQFS